MATIRAFGDEQIDSRAANKQASILVETDLIRIKAKHVKENDIFVRPAPGDHVARGYVQLLKDTIVDAKFQEGTGAVSLYFKGDIQWSCHRDEMIYVIRTNIAFRTEAI